MRHKILYIAITIIILSLIIGFLPYNPIAYYIVLILLILYSIYYTKYINTFPFLLIFFCAISIILNSPPSFFKSWQRLGLFSLVIGTTFPIFQSKQYFILRYQIFNYLIATCSIIGSTSVFCYILGINYMTKYYGFNNISINTSGIFSGLTRHSMMLGIVSAIGLVHLIFLFTKRGFSKKRKILIGISSFLCFCSILLSASRISLVSAVIGILVILYLRYQSNTIRLIKICIISLSALAITYPMYDQFATPMLEKQKNNIEAGSTFNSRQDRWGHRIDEFKSSPIFGIGFATIDSTYTSEYNSNLGIVEPGSSWLAVLSMTGLTGAILIISIAFNSLKVLYKKYKENNIDDIVLIIGLLSMFFIHLIAEGYIYAGGSFLCFLFWLTLGIGNSYTKFK